VTDLLSGRYRIDGLLGRGGMSEVYFGYDERLDRPVAVKLLRPPSYVPESPDSPEAVEILDALDRDQRRFLREIRMTARLELAGVPAVYDTGADDRPDGTRQLWLVMQLLRGSTLETELRAVRPLLVAAYGPDSAQVSNLDKQAARLGSEP